MASISDINEKPEIRSRPAAVAMRLSRMGSAHPTRLSFLRIMLRRMQAENWRFERARFDLDDRGVGTAVYSLHGPERSYSLVAFSHDLPDEMRSDRVIATAWDATFALFDGVPGQADIDRLARNVPLQEAGRVSSSELSLSRANRSVRLFRHVVAALSEGHQPDTAEVFEVGYLMRTTAVYGSGKFGAQDRSAIRARPETMAPFQVEMMSVWLTKTFTIDLVNHLAAVRGGARAVPLAPDIARAIGVGNSTGLGMAPFLVRHPRLLHAWAAAREEALARVRRSGPPAPRTRAILDRALEDARENAAHWRSEHPLQIAKLAALRHDLSAIAVYLDAWPAKADATPWNTLWRWGAVTLAEEGQEALLSLMLEPNGALVDDLEAALSAEENSATPIDGRQRICDLRAEIEDRYDWALAEDFGAEGAEARCWYVSEEKLEPRLGLRGVEIPPDLEQPLGIAALVRGVYDAMRDATGDTLVADFLLRQPEHRLIVRRIQILRGCDYGEIRENLLAEHILPIDMMRYKLAFFGASRFDPRSDKWVRISLFAGLPLPEEIGRFDDWL